MGVRETLFAGDRSRRADGPVRLLQLRRLRERVQVAAVCYRVGRKGIEFLLVQTRGSGRWTFPKGGTEPGLTHAQAAAVEAFEEAGVHGRIEEASFARYLRRKKGRCKDSNSPTVATKAHLCEVLWRDSPEETGRNPSWFSPEKAKQRLRQERSADFAAEIARVVDHAVARIQRLRSAATASDTLQKVQFEFFERTNNHGWHDVGISRYLRHARRDGQQSAAIELAVHAHLSKVLQFAPPQGFQQNRALRAGHPVELAGVAEGSAAAVPRPPRLAGNAPQEVDVAVPKRRRKPATGAKIAGSRRQNQ